MIYTLIDSGDESVHDTISLLGALIEHLTVDLAGRLTDESWGLF